MNNLNSVIVDGNLTADPEFLEFDNSAVCKFTVAVNRSYKVKDGDYKSEAVFIPIEVWNSSAKACSNYLHKGDGVRVLGRLKEEKWEDEKTSIKHSKILVIAEKIDFLNKKKKDEVITIDCENNTETSEKIAI